MGRIGARWIHHAMITRHGAKLPILPGTLDVFVTMAKQNSSLDYWVFRGIERILPENGVVYDIGANVGYLAVELAHKHAQDGVRVVAFEPNGELVPGIRKALDLNGLHNLQVMEMALGAEQGEVSFSVMPHSIHSSVISGQERAKSVVRVPQETIDHLVGDGTIPAPNVMKIDVEGYEYAVLQGARKTISRYKPAIVFEISDQTGKMIASLDELEKYFNCIGGYRVCDLRGNPVDLASVQLAPGSHRDLVALTDGPHHQRFEGRQGAPDSVVSSTNRGRATS